MPIDYSKYPDNWKTEIRPRILERAQHKCEWCGLPNYALVMRSPVDDHYLRYDADHDVHIDQDGDWIRLSEMDEKYADVQYVKIVLTIAHIHDSDPMACDDDNLAALCQKCHNGHDAKDRASNARLTRLQKKREQIRQTGQMELFNDLR